ncbi:DUF2946 family protein [Modicisalibacter xianhensis]|uniref:DUF2946 family protein n=1 Tax=Modicisalibacter xianhensis TaxID=442341 RepID=A0A4R8FYJ4_9GAMM|nr:DUF2946 domain-containing protein [Halomonas xianhensis]TDX29353.1 DUF2946 family protein [Halomonas xianhensis]
MPLRHHARAYRHAVHLALIAMLLLVTGPVIGQLSAFGEPGHHSHAGASMPTLSSPPAHQSQLPETLGWHEQCGYCSLFHHSPVLSGALPAVAHTFLLAAGEPLAATRPAHGGLAIFPHALTRAPPVVVRDS